MIPVYQKEVFIPFHLADPAGKLFFGHIFILYHEVYEAFIQQILKEKWESRMKKF